MIKHEDEFNLVDLGAASEETRGNPGSGQETGGFVKNSGLSDDD